VFKGPGFYATDYRSEGGAGSKSPQDKKGKDSGKKDTGKGISDGTG
jgi:predicted nucleic acid-binding Zn ribbon protein